MPSPDHHLTNVLSWVFAHLQSGADIRSVLAAPVILSAIVIVHWCWFRKHLSTNGQQRVELTDLSDLCVASCAELQQPLTLVDATNKMFNAGERTSSDSLLPFPTVEFGCPQHKTLRFPRSHVVEGLDVPDPLICAEDLDVLGTSCFLGAIKVGGDLVVRGNATFFSAVIVNGILKIEGKAHFTEGVVAKGETYVTGEMSIGSQERKGWAALTEFALASRLRLNGRVVTTRAIQIRKAA